MTYAISNTQGDHLGFIVLSGGPDAGECLVRSLPFENNTLDTSESDYLLELQTLGELQWQRVTDEFRIIAPDGNIVLVEKGGTMKGSGFVYVVEAVS